MTGAGKWRRGLVALAVLIGMLTGGPAAFAISPWAGASGLGLPGMANGTTQTTWTILVLLSVLTLIPAILVSITPFARILIVFHFLRQALGTQSAPSNQTLIGLALFLTYFIMQPVGTQIYDAAIVPLQQGSVSALGAVELSSVPLKKFMLKYARERDLALFVDLTNSPRPHRPEDLPMRVVIPAYMISELKAGFQIGMVLFLPFMVIDLVVAAVTTSVGMLQLPPVVISTPLKVVLFVMVDGWHLIVGSLMKSFF